MPSLSKRNSNRPSPAPHIEYRLAGLKRQQLYKIPSPFIPLKRIVSPPPISLQTHPLQIPICGKQLRTILPISHGPTS